jgi:hypothetical protein
MPSNPETAPDARMLSALRRELMDERERAHRAQAWGEAMCDRVKDLELEKNLWMGRAFRLKSVMEAAGLGDKGQVHAW